MVRCPLVVIRRSAETLLACVLLCQVAVAQVAEPSPAPAKAHARGVVVILMDDVAYDDLGCHGNPVQLTPRIDRLAAEGVSCSRAYATAATCSPSRAAILTGRYQQRFGHEFNPQHQISKGQGLSSTEVTVARRFSWRGFSTGAFGKWHLGCAVPSHPLGHGFDQFYGFLAGSRSYRPYTGRRLKRQNQFNRMLLGREPIEEDFGYLTTELGHRAADFIAQHAEEPFFLFLSFSAVHEPLHADPNLELELPKDLDEQRRLVLNMLASLDSAVGEVLDALDEHGRRDDTLVVLLSDNGGTTREGIDNWELLGKKGELLEGGVRVPMILRWPGRLPAGLDYGENVSTLDLVPTALAATGGKLPAGLDGVDLAPYLSGPQPEQPLPHPILYWRQGEQWAVLSGDDKIVDRGAGPFYRDLGDREGGIRKLNKAELEPSLSTTVEELLAAHATWAKDLRTPKWRKYTLDQDGD